MAGMVGGRVQSTALVLMLASTVACAGPVGAWPLPSSTYVAHAPLTSGTRRCSASMTRGVVTRANDERHRVHLAALVADESLTRAANARARSMAAQQRLSHDGWDEVVHGNMAAGENIAYNYATADAVMRG